MYVRNLFFPGLGSISGCVSSTAQYLHDRKIAANTRSLSRWLSNNSHIAATFLPVLQQWSDFRRNQARKERKQSGIPLPTEQGLKVGHLDLICKLQIAPPDFLPITFSCPIPSHRQLRPNLFSFNLKSNTKDPQDSNYGVGHGGKQVAHPVILPLPK